ncbi:MAG: metallophosphoesterase, partial [Sedimentisphaerales bacterium]|nr:metallophosphoesterase [Sedimentisphaerales bacterium]
LDTFPPDVDVILYLGDGANSGGTDEIEKLFRALEDHRSDSGTPIFVVIGNHDYLGAGNTTDPVARFLLLNHLQPEQDPPLPETYNRALSKYEVLCRISAFNRDSNDLATNTMFLYADNNDVLDPALDHDTGLYLAGHLLYPKHGKKTVEMFLADTSDYIDTWFSPELTLWDPFIPQWDFYGVQGSISSRDRTDESGAPIPSQITYFKERAVSPPADFRFVASHYHPDNLDRKRDGIPESWLFEMANAGHGFWETVGTLFFGHDYANQHLKDWLSDGRENYWLSAHTHRKSMMRPGQGKVHVGGIVEILTDDSFRSVNIGSTTDYRAHVAVIEGFSRRHAALDPHVRKVDEYVQFREIPLFDAAADQEKQLLHKLLNHIEAYGRAHRDAEHCVEYKNDIQFGLSLLGLNKDYQDERWTVEATRETCQCLDLFIDTLVSENEDSERADLIRCLTFIASACEMRVCDCGKGFDPGRCRIK